MQEDENKNLFKLKDNFNLKQPEKEIYWSDKIKLFYNLLPLLLDEFLDNIARGKGSAETSVGSGKKFTSDWGIEEIRSLSHSTHQPWHILHYQNG